MTCEGDDCQDALMSLYVLLDQELEYADCEQIQAHVDECPECSHEFAAEKLIKALVHRSCPETAPSVLRDRVLLSIRTLSIEIQREI